MTKAELLALADRCEAAPPEQQRELLIEAWATINGPAVGIASIDPRFPAFARLFDMLDCGAYESAALSMMPKGCKFFIDVADGRYLAELWRANNAITFPGLQLSRTVPARASTLALAITAAILRARAEEIE